MKEEVSRLGFIFLLFSFCLLFAGCAVWDGLKYGGSRTAPRRETRPTTRLALLVILLSSFFLSSCADLPAMIREAAKDHANVHIEVNTIYGRVVYDRSNPPLVTRHSSLVTAP